MAALQPLTPAQFFNRFPTFEDWVEDEALSNALLLASRFVDTSWAEADQQPAMAYLVAHLLTLGQEQAEGGVIVSESLGGISATYASRQAVTSDWNKSEYGRVFYQLLRANQMGPVVI